MVTRTQGPTFSCLLLAGRRSPSGEVQQLGRVAVPGTPLWGHRLPLGHDRCPQAEEGRRAVRPSGRMRRWRTGKPKEHHHALPVGLPPACLAVGISALAGFCLIAAFAVLLSQKSHPLPPSCLSVGRERFVPPPAGPLMNKPFSVPLLPAGPRDDRGALPTVTPSRTVFLSPFVTQPSRFNALMPESLPGPSSKGRPMAFVHIF